MEFLTGAISDFLQSSGVWVAYLVIYLIIFAESGILLGFFLPGDSLLLTLGLLASQGFFNLPLLLLIGSIAAITGDSVGYAFGRKVGPALFNRPDSRFFKQENLRRAHAFYERYGTRTIVLARFIPFARTFAPILAGIAKMDYRVFVIYNVAGGIGWIVSLTLLGYFLGQLVPNIDHYVLYIVGTIILASVIPAYLEYRKHQREKRNHAHPPA